MKKKCIPPRPYLDCKVTCKDVLEAFEILNTDKGNIIETDEDYEETEICPECEASDLESAECSNTDCKSCGSLVYWCYSCGWTDHENCDLEEEE